MTRPTETSSLNAAIAERFFGLKHPVTAYAWNDRKKREKPYHVYRERGTSRDRGYLTNGWSNVIYDGYATLITETGEKLTRYYMLREYHRNDGLALAALRKILELFPQLTVKIVGNTDRWGVHFMTDHPGSIATSGGHETLALAIVHGILALPPSFRSDR